MPEFTDITLTLWSPGSQADRAAADTVPADTTNSTPSNPTYVALTEEV